MRLRCLPVKCPSGANADRASAHAGGALPKVGASRPLRASRFCAAHPAFAPRTARLARAASRPHPVLLRSRTVSPYATAWRARARCSSHMLCLHPGFRREGVFRFPPESVGLPRPASCTVPRVRAAPRRTHTTLCTRICAALRTLRAPCPVLTSVCVWIEISRQHAARKAVIFHRRVTKRVVFAAALLYNGRRKADVNASRPWPTEHRRR